MYLQAYTRVYETVLIGSLLQEISILIQNQNFDFVGLLSLSDFITELVILPLSFVMFQFCLCLVPTLKLSRLSYENLLTQSQTHPGAQTFCFGLSGQGLCFPVFVVLLFRLCGHFCPDCQSLTSPPCLVPSHCSVHYIV